jgi:F420-non-reducing hydrogenase small subunit
MSGKPKLAVYWSASCGGCEVAVANLHEHLLEVAEHFDFMFCPCLLDTKKKDIEALEDGEITATLFNGAIRTEENREMAHLLRRKSKLLVAMGACAASGGIPALSNLSTRAQILRAAYLDSPTLDNLEGVVPQERTLVPEGELRLPHFFERVLSLGDVVPVDYTIPGCPPEPDQLWNVIKLLMRALEEAEPLPCPGAVMGAGPSSVCDECARTRSDKRLTGFRRVWEFLPDEEQCLMDQGLVCMGMATRSGCGGLCPAVNMPCIGCYGPPEGVFDQGAKLAATLGSIIDIDPIRDERRMSIINQKVDQVVAQVPDLAGTACKFSMASHRFNGETTTRKS